MPKRLMDFGKIKQTRKSLGLPEKFDPEGDDYDYETAIKAGMGPSENDQHWASRVASGPDEGRILKGRGHPTFWKTLETEEASGYEVYKGADGKYHSRKKLHGS